MSIYTSAIKTHIIDPVYNRSNYRAEYRLESDTVFLSNFRLVGIGATSTGATANYSDITGAQGVIQQISLYDDNQLLDQLLQSQLWLSFKNYNNKNQVNMDLKQNLHKNMMGNQWGGKNVGVGAVGAKISQFDVKRGTMNVDPPNFGTDATDVGWLDLKQLFPLLSNMTAIPTTVFKGLKVVVQYETDPEMFCNNTTNAPFSTTEAQLIADEVVGDIGKSKLGKFNGVSYVSIEHDRVRIPKISVSAGNLDNVNPVIQQTQTVHINGFNNKTVGRCLIVKSPTEATSYKTGAQLNHYGKTGSKCSNKEILQIRVNGSSVLSGKGITGSNQRLAMLNDVWGTCSTIPFANGEGYLAS